MGNHLAVKELVDKASALLRQDEHYQELIGACTLDYEATAYASKDVSLERMSFDCIGCCRYGSNEGIYGDVLIHGLWRSSQIGEASMSVYTFKTLRTDKDAYLAMGTLATLFAYYMNKVVEENYDRFQ